jgi:hypothetical protein
MIAGEGQRPRALRGMAPVAALAGAVDARRHLPLAVGAPDETGEQRGRVDAARRPGVGDLRGFPEGPSTIGSWAAGLWAPA